MKKTLKKLKKRKPAKKIKRVVRKKRKILLPKKLLSVAVGFVFACFFLFSVMAASNAGSWAPVSTVNAPTARSSHTAIWTGSKMIVWGGINPSIEYLNTGGIYDPATDTWTAMSTINAPAGRTDHSVAWTGSKMIVWGGSGDSYGYNTGGIYDPATDTWTSLSTANAPAGREKHSTVWTGSKMIVWGGSVNGQPTNTGGIYDPATNSWRATNRTLGLTNLDQKYVGVPIAPPARWEHAAIWTGSKMIVWGGYVSGGTTTTGALYDPETDQWNSTSNSNTPARRELQTAVWTGSKMIVWGGCADGCTNYFGTNTGGIFDPEFNNVDNTYGIWKPTNLENSPTGRLSHTATWAGSKMIVWGGVNTFLVGGSGKQYYNSGGIYDPATDSWTAMSTVNAPTARYAHSAVWTGRHLIIWGGGQGATGVNTGGIYTP